MQKVPSIVYLSRIAHHYRAVCRLSQPAATFPAASRDIPWSTTRTCSNGKFYLLFVVLSAPPPDRATGKMTKMSSVRNSLNNEMRREYQAEMTEETKLSVYFLLSLSQNIPRSESVDLSFATMDRKSVKVLLTSR